MISFSESEEYVRRTATWQPLAGYLQWYPTGTTWVCGYGAGINEVLVPISKPRGPSYADLYAYTDERFGDYVSMWLVGADGSLKP
jgi:hypothetical protein